MNAARNSRCPGEPRAGRKRDSNAALSTRLRIQHRLVARKRAAEHELVFVVHNNRAAGAVAHIVCRMEEQDGEGWGGHEDAQCALQPVAIVDRGAFREPDVAAAPAHNDGHRHGGRAAGF